jgi:hypothetical protein
MYIYNKPATAPRNFLSPISGLGGDRYIPAKNVDPVTGQPTVSERVRAPWAVVEVGLRNILCRFYQNAPRELIIPGSLPHTMEISVPGNTFSGSCHPRQLCPEEVHQNAPARDKLRERRCAEWREQWDREAANIIADPEFRANITERVLDVAGITGAGRFLTKPAEFVEVIQEREARETSIRLVAFIFLAGAGGILTFNAVRKYAKKRAARKAAEAESDASMGEIEENAKRVFTKEYYPGAGGDTKRHWRKPIDPDAPPPWKLNHRWSCERYGYDWVPGHCR